jgi:NAD(P)-dependent dehydrogenase (short-subunit alcohol dehydrogenase family)
MPNTTQPKALVTGGSSGIGRAIVARLEAQGVKTLSVSRNSPQHPLDLSQVATVKDNISQIVQAMGTIDLLVNCAGIAYIGALADMPLPEWQRLFDINVTAVFQTIQAVLPFMRQQRSGTIINVASIAGKQGFPNWSAYCASKFALLGMTQALAEEERSHGIRVMSICPASVNTPIWDTLGDKVPPNFDRNAMLSPETVADTVIQMWQLPASTVITDLVLMSNAGVF